MFPIFPIVLRRIVVVIIVDYCCMHKPLSRTISRPLVCKTAWVTEVLSTMGRLRSVVIVLAHTLHVLCVSAIIPIGRPPHFGRSAAANTHPAHTCKHTAQQYSIPWYFVISNEYNIYCVWKCRLRIRSYQYNTDTIAGQACVCFVS